MTPEEINTRALQLMDEKRCPEAFDLLADHIKRSTATMALRVNAGAPLRATKDAILRLYPYITERTKDSHGQSVHVAKLRREAGHDRCLVCGGNHEGIS